MNKNKNIAIKIKNLEFSYSNEQKIFSNLNLDIKKGDLIAILGPNGGGKSTLMKLIVNLLKPKKGNIKVYGKISYIPQKYTIENNFPAKVEEILSIEKTNLKVKNKVINELGIKNLLNKQFLNLSGGQKQKVLIALALISKPDILILDEPTVGIDQTSQEKFYKLLKDLNEKENLTILFVTHDTGMVSNYFKSIICIFGNSVCYDKSENINTALHKTYGCEFHQLIHKH